MRGDYVPVPNIHEAKYKSKCPICGDDINVGDEIRLEHETEEWGHLECVEEGAEA